MKKLTHPEHPHYSRETLQHFVQHAEGRLAEMQKLEAPPIVIAMCEKTLAAWQALLNEAKEREHE